MDAHILIGLLALGTGIAGLFKRDQLAKANQRQVDFVLGQDGDGDGSPGGFAKGNAVFVSTVFVVAGTAFLVYGLTGH